MAAQNMMHYDLVRADTVGTTINTPETIGTVQLLPSATNLHFINTQMVSTATTTSAEATSGVHIINWRGLNPDLWYIPQGMGIGGAGATNIDPIFDMGKITPFSLAKKMQGNIGNARITTQFDARTPEPTAEVAVQHAICYSVGSTNSAHLTNRGLAISGAIRSKLAFVDESSDAAFGAAATAAFDDGDIDVPSWVSKIACYGIQVNLDSVGTAGEHLIGEVALSGSVQGLDPMRIPVPGFSAALGAAASQPLQFGELILPADIPIPNADVAITPTGVVQQVLTGDAAQCIFGLYGY